MTAQYSAGLAFTLEDKTTFHNAFLDRSLAH
jgi:hypothetical protein